MFRTFNLIATLCLCLLPILGCKKELSASARSNKSEYFRLDGNSGAICSKNSAPVSSLRSSSEEDGALPPPVSCQDASAKLTPEKAELQLTSRNYSHTE